MADVSGWDAATPSGSSLVSKGDDKFRSLQSDVEETWEEEHFFLADNSGASAGIHRPGSARVDFGTASASTSTDEGRLYYDVDDGVLVVQGSSATTALSGGDAKIKGARVEAGSSNSQGFPDGTSSLVSWGNEVFDNGGYFTLSNGSATSFEIPSGEDGLYEVRAHMDATGEGFISQGGGEIEIQVNGGASLIGTRRLPSSLSTIIRSSSTSHVIVSANTINAIGVSGTGQLSEGDTVSVRLRQDSGDTQVFDQGTTGGNYFEIIKIGTV